MQDQNQKPPEVNAGVASEEDSRRKLMLEIEESLSGGQDLDEDEKTMLLQKMNLMTMVELEKTRQELSPEGKAAREDQKKQEKGSE